MEDTIFRCLLCQGVGNWGKNNICYPCLKNMETTNFHKPKRFSSFSDLEKFLKEGKLTQEEKDRIGLERAHIEINSDYEKFVKNTQLGLNVIYNAMDKEAKRIEKEYEEDEKKLLDKVDLNGEAERHND